MPGNSQASHPIDMSIPRSLVVRADEVIERSLLPARSLRLRTPVNGTPSPFSRAAANTSVVCGEGDLHSLDPAAFLL
jgi:hypothetical protein